MLAAACGGESPPDAYGNFEADEVVVSAQTSGQIERFSPVEGMRLEQGVVVALIDTTQLSLERRQLDAQRAAVGARRNEITEQLRVLEVQRELSRRSYERTRRLYDQQAATAQQLDQGERDYRVLGAQMAAVRAQRENVGMDVAANEARVRQIDERIAKSSVVNPQSGTVLATYARTGEMVQPGQPLYAIADLDTLVLRAYVSGAQLTSIQLGQPVEVQVEQGDGPAGRIRGTVTWISPTAEFTPTPVQTREDRADLVYAVKVRVPNEGGALKIGMPGDITLGPVTNTGADVGAVPGAGNSIDAAADTGGVR